MAIGASPLEVGTLVSPIEGLKLVDVSARLDIPASVGTLVSPIEGLKPLVNSPTTNVGVVSERL